MFNTHLTLLLGVILLLALWGASHLFKKHRNKEVNKDLQILTRLALGPKQSLIVVRYHDKEQLIGLSEAGFQFLAGNYPDFVFDEPFEDDIPWQENDVQ